MIEFFVNKIFLDPQMNQNQMGGMNNGFRF